MFERVAFCLAILAVGCGGAPDVSGPPIEAPAPVVDSGNTPDAVAPMPDVVVVPIDAGVPDVVPTKPDAAPDVVATPDTGPPPMPFTFTCEAGGAKYSVACDVALSNCQNLPSSVAYMISVIGSGYCDACGGGNQEPMNGGSTSPGEACTVSLGGGGSFPGVTW